jgi:hypothetical protein
MAASGMFDCVVWSKMTGVLEELTASILRRYKDQGKIEKGAHPTVTITTSDLSYNTKDT